MPNTRRLQFVFGNEIVLHDCRWWVFRGGQQRSPGVGAQVAPSFRSCDPEIHSSSVKWGSNICLLTWPGRRVHQADSRLPLLYKLPLSPLAWMAPHQRILLAPLFPKLVFMTCSKQVQVHIKASLLPWIFFSLNKYLFRTHYESDSTKSNEDTTVGGENRN